MEIAEATIRILIVEDVPLVRQLVRGILGTEPAFEVISEASGGRDAVRQTQTLHPDIIVLDIGLPDMSGFEVAEQMRSSAPQSEIVFLSQHSGEEVVRRALATGAQGYVVKSDVWPELVTAVRSVSGHKPFLSSHATIEGPRGA